MRFYAFLAVNDVPRPGELEARIDEYARLGLDGVVWHPHDYPAHPAYLGDEYLRILSGAILHARERGLAFWIHDENLWPAGPLDRLVEQAVPGCCVRWLECSPTSAPVFQREVRVREKPGPSTFTRACAEAFISLAHKRYRTGLDPEAFAHVEAFFSDEVRFTCPAAPEGADVLPWPPEVEERLRDQGLDTSPQALLGLFGGDSEKIRALRRAYWEAVTDSLVAGFYEPLRTWCDAHGKRLAAHLKGEETPFLQVANAGSALQVLGATSLPGVDALERRPHNRYFPRLASSVAAQLGDGRSMCEAFGGAGNGSTAADLVRYVRWIADCGVTDVVLHLDHLRLDAAAMRDWPAAMPTYMTWKPVFRSVLRSLANAEREGAAAAGESTVVVVPMRTVQECFVPGELAGVDELDGSGEPDTASARLSDAVVALMDDAGELGVSPHLVEERSLERLGHVEGCELVVGKARYQRVVAFAEAYASPVVSRMLTGLSAAGGEVLTPEGWLARLGKVTTSFEGMPETLAVGEWAHGREDARRASGASGGGLASPSRSGEDARAGARGAGAPVERVVPAQSPWRITPPARNLLKVDCLPVGKEEPEDDELEGEVPAAAAPVCNAPGCGSPESLAAAGPTPGSPCPADPALRVATLHFSEDLSDVACTLMTSDHVRELTWDDVPLSLGLDGHGRHVATPAPELCGAGEHRISFLLADEPRPAVYLAGRFCVWSRLWPFDGRQMTSRGTFELWREGSLSELSADLLESGYPFAFLPVTLEKTIRMSEAGRFCLGLCDVEASAARVRVDAGEPVDVWGPDFRTPPIELAAGEHAISVEVYNSTYNVLGPHHYYRGDVGLVTPAQFEGTRNFADPDHAPAHTSVDAWHFVRWGVGADLDLTH